MKSLVQFFNENVERYHASPYMWEKRDGSFKSTSYEEMKTLVHRFAAGLITLGVKKGDRLALLAEGRTWWAVAEFGMFHV
ncbi:MAG: AMP-binding protein, partial [Bacteroidales bacterium]